MGDEERERAVPTVVGKAPCGHYKFACVVDEHFGLSDLRTISDLTESGWTIEMKTVGFVRDGGLTFCKCAKTKRKKANG